MNFEYLVEEEICIFFQLKFSRFLYESKLQLHVILTTLFHVQQSTQNKVMEMTKNIIFLMTIYVKNILNTFIK